MPNTWQTVRVFISSTFRDMHAERDHLVKIVFPRLRQWCDERRLHLVDIDLRWGVTKVEADNGKAIEICLKEIDGSRPFFLCILGGRYGWVPDELPPEEMYLFRGLQTQTHLSITHLEIQHAALGPIPRTDGQQKQVCQQSFFYFRRPGCVPPPEDVDAAHRAEHRKTFFEPLPERESMLADLKQDIREYFTRDGRVFDYDGTWDDQAENPEDDALHGRLSGLETWGLRVEADIQRGIREQFAAHLATLAETPDPLEEERAQHAAFIENRTQVHVPRVDFERAISDYVWGASDRALVISGPPGSGKSATVAHWLKQQADLDTWHATHDRTTFVVARFIGASAASTNLGRLLASVCEDLRQRFELTEVVDEEVEVAPGQEEKRTRPQNMEVPADPAEVVRKWPKFLEAAASQGQVIIVLDAINQLDRTADPALAYWIPRKLPAGVRLVISVLDHGEKSRPEYRPSHGEPADWLGGLRRAGLASLNDRTELPIPELDDASRGEIIQQLPSVFCKTLEPRFVTQLLKNPATRNPLFLLVALEELRVFGSFEKLAGQIAGLPCAEGPQDIDHALDAIFGQVLDRLDADTRRQARSLRALPAENGLVPTIFRFLASAREGLSEQEQSELLSRHLPSTNAPERYGALQFVLRQVRSYLMRKAHPQGTLVDFYHRSFWKAVRRKYLPDTPAQYAVHRDLADYFQSQDYWLESLEEQQRRAKALPPTPRPANVRKVDELPWQLLQAADWQRSEQLLTDLAFLEAKAEAGMVFSLAADFSETIGGMPADRPLVRILRLLEEALRRDIYFIGRHPTTLFQCMWNSCWWYDSSEAAKHYEELEGGRKCIR